MNRKIIARKKDRVINIFYPCSFSSNYIRYEYIYIDSDSDNMHQWRVRQIAIADSALCDTFLLNGSNEWEGAILELGAPDFMGGYHGDENNTGIAILVDNKLVCAEEDFEVECDRIKITATSLLNRANTPNDNVFARIKVSEWNSEGYSVTNRFELLQDLEIHRFENIMMGLPLFKGEERFITHAASNTHPIPVFVSADSAENRDKPIFAGDHFASAFEYFAPEHNFYASVKGIFDLEKYPNGFRLFDNWRVGTDKVIKAYFNMTGKHSGKKGEVFESKAIYTLEA